MLVPLQKPPKKRFSRHKPKMSISKDVPVTTSLSSHPVKPIPVRTIQEETPKQVHAPAEEEKEKESKEVEGEPVQSDPLGKLALRMKSLLKRRSNGEKKEKRPRFELDRVETVHWTEL